MLARLARVPFALRATRWPLARARAAASPAAPRAMWGSVLPSSAGRVAKPAFTQVQSARFLASASSPESFLSGTSGYYVDDMYRRWRENPSSVHASWDAYFKSGSYAAAPSVSGGVATSTAGGGAPAGMTDQQLSLSARAVNMVRAFQVRGHYLANIDPLGLNIQTRRGGVPQELQLEHYGFSESDLDQEVHVGMGAMSGFLSNERETMKLRDLHKRLRETYAGTIGVEYMHIPDTDKCNFIRERFETVKSHKVDKESKRLILERLMHAQGFATFLAKKFGASKRFGIDGGETLLPGMQALIDQAGEEGVASVVIGMPHRGRLNVLANVMGKPLEHIFKEFKGLAAYDVTYEGSGDVKYHLGASSEFTTPTGKSVHLSLVPNPSHLEAVNPVVLGKARAKQTYVEVEHPEAGDPKDRVMSVLLHGDAAFAGQGVVYESMSLADLPEYTTGGTVHVVANNQIGFTTDPVKARSTPYCTSLGRAAHVPIFHVNGDDPEAVVRVHQIAAEYRQRFHSDVVIDLVCYRRYGHNEIDEPAFTQPRMYSKIRKHDTTLKLYRERLIEEGSFTKEEIDEMEDRIMSSIDEKFRNRDSFKAKTADWLRSNWEGIVGPDSPAEASGETSYDAGALQSIGERTSKLPDGFVLHPRLKGVMKSRTESVANGKDIDWGTAEVLAFGSLLEENHHVRLSGQDVERGTFSHRHAVVHDQEHLDAPPYVPLANLSDKQAKFTVCNSNLSEFGVLGFELGYSMENPNSLVLWEAQFGDFANGAQVMIDNFISSMESKWRRQTGLVMLLPHGYEGQGPEHSSARVERFLQMCSDHPDVYPETTPEQQAQAINWQVVNMTSSANYFHVLRRQLKRKFRKPLIVASPKKLLRHKDACSTLEEFGPGSSFQRLYPESKKLVADDKVRRVVFTTGKVHFALRDFREANNVDDVALVRVEQIAPFPYEEVAKQLARYKNAEVVWAQEEHMNMGAWTYVEPRIKTANRGGNGVEQTNVRYVGRVPSAATASGNPANHEKEKQALLQDAFA